MALLTSVPVVVPPLHARNGLGRSLSSGCAWRIVGGSHARVGLGMETGRRLAFVTLKGRATGDETSEGGLSEVSVESGEGETGSSGKEEVVVLRSEAEILRRKMKKLELRRRRLKRKRKMRKKGRWPPSKVKKNKNV